MNQKEIKAKYMEIICKEVWPSSERMQKYADKEYGYGVELDDGDICVIDKPSIKKAFCFGYGWCGVSDMEQSNRASEMVHHAETNTDYFISENMKDIDDLLETLVNPRWEAYKRVPYSGQPKDSKLKSVTFYRDIDRDEAEKYGYVKLSEIEVNAMIDGYKELKKMFRKRIDTYLKRYGLSKVNAWSYLRD